ncbi:hypothetical protein FB446DRAFT_789149 [Lentinula raphanica]|nr:hypothetical protein FB446DRAFT_789149 [Lentinula raphanica]
MSSKRSRILNLEPPFAPLRMPVPEYNFTVFFNPNSNSTTLVNLPSLASIGDSTPETVAPSSPSAERTSQVTHGRVQSMHERFENHDIGEVLHATHRGKISSSEKPSLLSQVTTNHIVKERHVNPKGKEPANTSLRLRATRTPTQDTVQSEMLPKSESSIVTNLGGVMPSSDTSLSTANWSVTYTNLHTRKTRMKGIEVRWYSLTTQGPLERPPELPVDHSGLEDNDLFVHVNEEIRRTLINSPPVTNGRPTILTCTSFWVWDSALGRWEVIHYGETRRIANRLDLALSLYRSSHEPLWITPEAMRRRQPTF